MEKKFTLLILKQATKSTHKLKVIIVSFANSINFCYYFKFYRSHIFTRSTWL